MPLACECFLQHCANSKGSAQPPRILLGFGFMKTILYASRHPFSLLEAFDAIIVERGVLDPQDVAEVGVEGGGGGHLR